MIFRSTNAPWLCPRESCFITVTRPSYLLGISGRIRIQKLAYIYVPNTYCIRTCTCTCTWWNCQRPRVYHTHRNIDYRLISMIESINATNSMYRYITDWASSSILVSTDPVRLPGFTTCYAVKYFTSLPVGSVYLTPQTYIQILCLYPGHRTYR